MEYYSFDLKPQPERKRKTKTKVERLHKYPMIAPEEYQSDDRPQEDQPTSRGHWEKSPVTGNWTFIRDQQPRPTGPIVVHLPVKPAHVPAPNMKPMVIPAPKPIRITRQHRARAGGITRRGDR
jgi:hypothetical protein